MDTFYKLAGKYYYRFFGAHLLPRWSNWRCLLCFGSAVLFGLSTFWLIADPNPPVRGVWLVLITLLAVICLLVACASILIYSRNQELANCDVPSSLSAPERLSAAKRKFLSELTKRPSSEFLAIVDEIKELQALENSYRTPIDPDFSRIFRKLLDPQLITSVIAIVLSALGIFFGLIEKSTLREITDVFHSKDSIKEIADLNRPAFCR